MHALQTKHLLLLLAGTLAAGALVAVGLAVAREPYRPAGSLIEPARAAPEIHLEDAAGVPFSLSALRGSVVLLFFGYTNCPDVCPTTLADVQHVFEQLGPERQSVRLVFVTVDPARDTPERMADYLGRFSRDFIGLPGPEEGLQDAYRDYNVGVEVEHPHPENGYDVAHTSRIFVIDRQGNLVETLPYGLDRESLLRDVRYWLARE